MDKPRNVLVFGAGVIGAYLTHVLIQADNNVTVLARKERAESLNKNGLVIYHHLQRKITRDFVEAITDTGGRSFDATFVVMPYHKLKEALPQIYEIDTKLLVLVGNDLSPAEIKEKIRENAPNIKKIMFGFQVSGGKKEEDRYICERFGASYMDLGQLHGRTSDKMRRWIEKMFTGTKYKLNWQDDMESYLFCHPAAILPIGYLSYICGGDLRKSTSTQRKMMFDASHEAFECLKKKGITVYPMGDDKFYGSGAKGKLMKFLYFIMAKSKIGDLIACEHCRNAVSEMEEIDLFYEKLLKDCLPSDLVTWNRLRSQMPSWQMLHRTYGN